jgi:hypothetical protein
MAMAASGSAHHHPARELSTRPPRSAAQSHEHSKVSVASAALGAHSLAAGFRCTAVAVGPRPGLIGRAVAEARNALASVRPPCFSRMSKPLH